LEPAPSDFSATISAIDPERPSGDIRIKLRFQLLAKDCWAVILLPTLGCVSAYSDDVVYDSVAVGEYGHVAVPQFVTVSVDDNGIVTDSLFDVVVCIADCGFLPRAMEYVQVLQVHGEHSRIRMEYAGEVFETWVENSVLIRSDAFKDVEEWDGDGEFVLCDDGGICLKFVIDEDAQYTVSRIARFDSRELPLIDCADSCDSLGRVQKFGKYLRMKTGKGFIVFEIVEDDQLCWTAYLDKYETCLPARPAYTN